MKKLKLLAMMMMMTVGVLVNVYAGEIDYSGEWEGNGTTYTIGECYNGIYLVNDKGQIDIYGVEPEIINKNKITVHNGWQSITLKRKNGTDDRKNEVYGTGCGIVSGAIAGAIVGSGIGIAGGPLGAIAGTIPGAIIGAITFGLTGNKIGSEMDRAK